MRHQESRNPEDWFRIGDKELKRAYNLLTLKDMLEEHAKVPGMIVEGDIVDLRVFNEAEALSKVEAFVETMDHYREIRRKKGLPW